MSFVDHVFARRLAGGFWGSKEMRSIFDVG
jgi:hypothetical protein